MGDMSDLERPSRYYPPKPHDRGEDVSVTLHVCNGVTVVDVPAHDILGGIRVGERRYWLTDTGGVRMRDIPDTGDRPCVGAPEARAIAMLVARRDGIITTEQYDQQMRRVADDMTEKRREIRELHARAEAAERELDKYKNAMTSPSLDRETLLNMIQDLQDAERAYENGHGTSQTIFNRRDEILNAVFPPTTSQPPGDRAPREQNQNGE